MKVRDVPVGEIRPYENNPRDNDAAVPAVAASLLEYGWLQPIVVDADGTIAAGAVLSIRCGFKERQWPMQKPSPTQRAARIRAADSRPDGAAFFV